MPSQTWSLGEQSFLGVNVIAIDGPVASGKTAVGRRLAQRLGFRYLDTGLMYRAITWLALRNATPMEDEEALGSLAHHNPIVLRGLESDEVVVAKYRVGPELREPQVDSHVSLVARVPAVRRALVEQQRVLAASGDIVMVGRDIGTVVLPDAELKVFLSASPQTRARRRWRDLANLGQEVPFQQVLQETKDRDDIDSHRDDSPLRPAEGAFLVDTDELSVEEAVDRIVHRLHEISAPGG